MVVQVLAGSLLTELRRELVLIDEDGVETVRHLRANTKTGEYHPPTAANNILLTTIDGESSKPRVTSN